MVAWHSYGSCRCTVRVRGVGNLLLDPTLSSLNIPLEETGFPLLSPYPPLPHLEG